MVQHVHKRLEHLSNKKIDLVDSPGGCIFADCSWNTAKGKTGKCKLFFMSMGGKNET